MHFKKSITSRWLLLLFPDSVVVKVTGYRQDDPDLDLQHGKRFFFFQNFQAGSGAHLASFSMGTGDSFLVSKAAGA
jgi:hypothetical protein